jgi:hypothetical protein
MAGVDASTLATLKEQFMEVNRNNAVKSLQPPEYYTERPLNGVDLEEVLKAFPMASSASICTEIPGGTS